MSTHEEIQIESAFVKYSDLYWTDSKRYYQHQKEVIESTKKVLVLDAPTGSGKTLAALARTIQRNNSAIFVYPTNTLVLDQVTAINNLLSDLGRTVRVIDGSKSLDPNDLDLSGCNTILIHATGCSLEILSDGSPKGSTMDRILTGSHESGILRILLTNPDTLYLAFAGWYYRHSRLVEQLFSFKSIVIDEFHLYAGPTLAKLFYILNLLRGFPNNPSMELIYLSATHGETLNLLSSSYNDLEVVRTETLSGEGTDRKQIRRRTLCSIRTKNEVLQSEVEEVAREIIQFYKSDYAWDEGKVNHVKVLAVVSSVVFAVRLARHVTSILESEGISGVVHQIHGLIPVPKRENIADMREAILIGTSAIEVGVDFDVPFLVMEAQDLASFLQRFGRGGRHSECKAILFLPTAPSIRFNEHPTWDFSEFVNEAHEAFHSMPSYADFLCQSEARKIVLALALAGSREHTAPWIKKRKFKTKDALSLLKALLSANHQARMNQSSFSDIFEGLSDDLLEDEFYHPLVTTLANNGFLRGTMNSVIARMNPALLGLEGATFYTEMDIFDLFRIQGHLEPIDFHQHAIPADLRKRHQNSDVVYVVDDIDRGSFPRIRIGEGYIRRAKTRVFDREDYHLLTPDPKTSEVVERLIHRRNAIFYTPSSFILEDYRIPRIYADGLPGAVVIGDWALVAEYLLRTKKRSNSK